MQRIVPDVIQNMNPENAQYFIKHVKFVTNTQKKTLEVQLENDMQVQETRNYDQGKSEDSIFIFEQNQKNCWYECIQVNDDKNIRFKLERILDQSL